MAESSAGLVPWRAIEPPVVDSDFASIVSLSSTGRPQRAGRSGRVSFGLVGSPVRYFHRSWSSLRASLIASALISRTAWGAGPSALVSAMRSR